MYKRQQHQHRHNGNNKQNQEPTLAIQKPSKDAMRNAHSQMTRQTERDGSFQNRTNLFSTLFLSHSIVSPPVMFCFKNLKKKTNFVWCTCLMLKVWSQIIFISFYSNTTWPGWHANASENEYPELWDIFRNALWKCREYRKIWWMHGWKSVQCDWILDWSMAVNVLFSKESLL